VTRVLITGASGFVGRHLVAQCEAAGEDVHADRVDLCDGGGARALVARARPHVIYHLAARAHVGASWADPPGTLRDNVSMAVNVLEAARLEAPEAVVVAVSSGEVYGTPAALPVTEDAPLRPQNPYAASKAAADVIAGSYADAYGLRVIRARAFNHAGPGQEERYAIASFAAQVAAGADTIVTGNPDSRRDYTDVRDVVRAYRLLAQAGEPGAYNVCSGRARSVRELVAALAEVARVPLRHEVDPALLRRHDVAEVRGSSARLTAVTGWQPEIPLERTLADTLAWCARSRGGPAAPNCCATTRAWSDSADVRRMDVSLAKPDPSRRTRQRGP
jgi:GDP-4-dehydro-6-deoxy-D-mannose reductase